MTRSRKWLHPRTVTPTRGSGAMWLLLLRLCVLGVAPGLAVLGLPSTVGAAGVVGAGTPASCTEDALDAALAAGGLVTFDCGADPVTIALTAEMVITAEIAIDGGGLVTLSGGDTVRVFRVNDGATLDVRNLTLADGRTDGDWGGGIVNSGTLTLTNCTLSGNSAFIGGGGIANFGTLTVINSTFSGNTASREYAGGGGGIYNFGTLTLRDCTLSGNSATSGGGGLSNGGIATLTNCTLSDNSASSGGGIGNSGTLALTDCTLSGNSAGAWAGGITNAGTATLTNCTLNGNSPGGISNFDTLTLANCTLSGNSGGIANLFGTATVTNCTLSENGRAILNAGDRYSECAYGSVTLTNTIIESAGVTCEAECLGGPLVYLVRDRNTMPAAVTAMQAGAGATGGIVESTAGADSGYFTDGGHNLQWPGTSCGETIPSRDPLLDPAGLKDNGGPTQTIALRPDSPATNTGDESICAAPPVNNLDQRGFVRGGSGAAHCSIGACEYNSPGPPCDVGDCNSDGQVTIDELLSLVNIALGNAQSACPHGVPSGADVDVAFIIHAVNAAAGGCGG